VKETAIDVAAVLARLRGYHSGALNEAQAMLDTGPHPSIQAKIQAEKLQHEQFVSVLDGIINGIKNPKEEKPNGG